MGAFADSAANALLRARKARLRGPRELRLLAAAGSVAALAAALDAEAAREPEAIGAALFSGLLDEGAALRRHYPRGARLFDARRRGRRGQETRRPRPGAGPSLPASTLPPSPVRSRAG